MVFQNYALYPHKSVRQNLEFPLRLSKLSRPKAARRVAETAELLNLTPLLERRPGQLSGGERQRVAMGRALVRNPSVFLMDEPLSNLDAKLRVQIRTEIAALQQRLNITTIYVTHDQTEAMTLGHRVAVMSDGQVQQVDVPLALYDRPANVFVAGFIGSPGMNVFSARVAGSDPGGRVLVIGDQAVADEAHSPIPTALAGNDSFLVGIRPESLMLEKVEPVTHGRLRLRVQSTETIGHEKLVYCVPPDAVDRPNEDDTIVARIPVNQSIGRGELVEFGFPLTRVSFFDRQGIAIR
jgi:ABC-type sugar transport system ATPase subunit